MNDYRNYTSRELLDLAAQCGLSPALATEIANRLADKMRLPHLRNPVFNKEHTPNGN